MTYWIWENLGIINMFESYTERGVIIVDVRDLSDVEKDVEKVWKKIITVTQLLCIGHKVAVRCMAGMNRSCAITTGVMMYMVKKGDIDECWDYHYAKVKENNRRAMVLPQMERVVKRAIKKMDERYV